VSFNKNKQIGLSTSQVTEIYPETIELEVYGFQSCAFFGKISVPICDLSHRIGGMQIIYGN
jgi:hypothetical protein